MQYLKTPTADTKIVFACDDDYYHKFGFYNILSCVNTNQAVHCHIINPTTSTIDNLELTNALVSYSVETVGITGYLLKSYYYCARYFVARDLFKNFNVTNLWITDADIIVKSNLCFPEDKKLGIAYNKDQTNLWKKTQAAVIYVHTDSKQFLDRTIAEYLDRAKVSNLEKLDTVVEKLERGNILGLDQVSMSVVLEQYYLDDKFLNLHDFKNLKSKSLNNDSLIWVLVGKNKHLLSTWVVNNS